MKRIFMLMTIFSVLIASGFASNELLFSYPCEENGGSLLIDASGNGLDSAIFSIKWDIDNAFGFYACEFDGTDDYTRTFISDFPDKFSLSAWVNSKDDNGLRTIYELENGNAFFELQISYTTGNVILNYNNNSANLSSLVIGSATLFPRDVYKFMTIHINNNGSYSFYVGNETISSGTLTGGIYNISGDIFLNIGSDFARATEYKGFLDSIKFYNYNPSVADLNNLIANDKLIIQTEDENGDGNGNGDDNGTPVPDNLQGIVSANIIDSVQPFINQTINNTDNIIINLNTEATCEFYLDGSLYKTFSGGVSYSSGHDISGGQHTARVYCYYYYNNTRYYELFPQYNFFINVVPETITFNILGSDFLVNDKELYLVTPCIKNVMNLGDFTKDINKELNVGGTHYFQKLNNGIASFSVPQGVYNFCIINGQIQYGENDFTQNYNINAINGLIDLGEFEVTNNITNNYAVTLNTFDIYEKTDPKAWGVTWVAIIGSLVLLILGTIVIFLGVQIQNGKIVIGGVFLVMSAFGVGVTSFIGVLF